ncbi:TPA: hypothetical protein ACIRGC_002314, partial [Streptococcus suis]
EVIPGLFNKLLRDFSCRPNFILDNDSHDIDGLDKNIMWFKGGKLSFQMFEEALLDYEVSVSLEQPKIERNSYIKGVYVEKRKGNRSFLLDKSKEKDFYISFSPSLNCLIGGRGTGKSTLRCLYTRLYFLNRHKGGIRKWLRVTLLRNVASKSFYIIQFC